MLFDLATDDQMQAARIFGGATMAALLAAPFFRGQAHRIKVVAAVLYVAGVAGFVLYVVF